MTATLEGCELPVKIVKYMEEQDSGNFGKCFEATQGISGHALKPTLLGAFNYIHDGKETQNTNNALEVFKLSQNLKQDESDSDNFNCIRCAFGLGH
jgi:hypothetical protein